MFPNRIFCYEVRIPGKPEPYCCGLKTEDQAHDVCERANRTKKGHAVYAVHRNGDTTGPIYREDKTQLVSCACGATGMVGLTWKHSRVHGIRAQRMRILPVSFRDEHYCMNGNGTQVGEWDEIVFVCEECYLSKKKRGGT